MKRDSRVSGIGTIGNIEWGTHFCQFYQAKEDLMETLIPYFKAGLESREFCLWVTQETLDPEEAKEALKRAVPNIYVHFENGQIEIISHADLRMKAGTSDPQKALDYLIGKVNQCLEKGYDGLRFSGNGLFSHEETWDCAIGKYKMIALCTYSVNECNATTSFDVIASHRFALIKREGKWEKIESSCQKKFRHIEKTQEKLQENENRYRMLFTNMPDGFGLLEVIYNSVGKPIDYRYLEINPVFEQFLGVKREQLLGRTMRESFPNLSPIALEKYNEVALSSQPIEFEIFSEIANKYLDIYAFVPEKGKVALILRDITRRKEAEEALRISEERYRILFTNMTEGFALVEVIYNSMGKPIDFRLIEINPAFELKMGVKKEETLGKPMIEIFPYLHPISIKNYGEVALTGQSTHYEVFSQVANKYLDIYMFSPEAGKIALMFRDITERKAAEAKLKETLDNLDKLVKARTSELQKAYNSLKETKEDLAEAQKMAHLGNWKWNIITDELHWSDEVYRIFGLEPQEFNPTFDAYLKHVHPADQDYLINVIKKASKGKPHSIDNRIITAKGEERIVHTDAEITFNEDNVPAFAKGTIQDITDRKLAEQKIQESEARYRSFIENFKGIAFQADENFIPVFLHGTVEEITGYSEEEFVSKQPWKKIIHPQDLPNIYEAEEKIRNSIKRASGEIDFRIIHKDGKTKWVHEIFQKIPGNNGNPDKYQGAIYDITERKEAEEALAKMEQIRIKEIHHRIKNNLQVISSLLDLQSETFSNHDVCKVPEVLEAFNESKNRVISMALIHEELYKGDSIDTLDFAAYLKKLTKDLFGSYNLGDNSNISLRLNLDQVYLNMDTAIPLGIIVNELVTNSFKHAFPDERKGEIQINLRKAETSATKNGISHPSKDCMDNDDFDYILEVSDNGRGIPKDIDIESLNSLGLQLVDILVEQIDGYLELKNDKGTEFIIWFNNLEA